MAFHFVNAIKHYLPSTIVAQAAQYYGEQPANVQQGVDALVPLSLAGILQQATSGHIASLLDYANKAFHSGILQNIAGTFTHAGGGIPAAAPGLLSDVFGSKTGTVANAVAMHAGLKGSTASGLLGTILPLALAIMNKYASDNDLSAGALTAMLNRQRKEILAAVPPGLDAGRILDLPPADAGTYSPPNGVPAPKSNNWAGPLIIGILVLVGIWYALRGCN